MNTSLYCVVCEPGGFDDYAKCTVENGSLLIHTLRPIYTDAPAEYVNVSFSHYDLNGKEHGQPNGDGSWIVANESIEAKLVLFGLEESDLIRARDVDSIGYYWRYEHLYGAKPYVVREVTAASIVCVDCIGGEIVDSRTNDDIRYFKIPLPKFAPRPHGTYRDYRSVKKWSD